MWLHSTHVQFNGQYNGQYKSEKPINHLNWVKTGQVDMKSALQKNCV